MSSHQRISSLEQMLQAEPEDVFLNYALALEYLRDQDKKEMAEVQFRKVIQLEASYVPAYYQLGKLLESKDPLLAIEQYRKGLDHAERKKDRKSAGEFREAIFMLED
jgi:hypothetical protein